MNKGNLVVLILLLIGGVAQAAVYKWVDESGKVHYGDRPPPESDVQSVAVPEGPSREEVDRARQQMRDKIDQYGKFSEEASPAEPGEKPLQQTKVRAISPDDAACFTPLSDVVQGPSAKINTPITPASLTRAQQTLLRDLFNKIDAYWQGTISDLRCMGSPSEPKSNITNLIDARTTVNWDVHKSRLTLETDSIGKESGVSKQLMQIFEVGDALYFTNNKPAFSSASNIALEGNRVELLTLNKNRVSFLIKQHISTAAGARRPRGVVRKLELSGRTLKLTELYYHNDMLSDSRSWVLNR